MPGIRFFINKELQSAPDTTAQRIAANLANVAAQIGATSSVFYVKSAIYDNILYSLPHQDGENLLSTGTISSHSASDYRYPVTNNIIFESNDKSIKVELSDVKIDVTTENNIIKTPVTKRRGTVKEFISARDVVISITGSIFKDSQYEFPIELLREFIKIFSIEDNISVSNVLINSYDVYKVVVESHTIPQTSNKYINACNFILKLISDEDINLIIEQER